MTGNAFTSSTSLGASSVQDYGTPPKFLRAVEDLIGEPLAFDLAAHENNHVCADWFGPGGVAPDALAEPWHEIDGALWLNPPFSASKKFARKCALESRLGARVAFLVPANVGADWFWDSVYEHAAALMIKPRIGFVGAPWRAWHKDLSKGSIAVPEYLQDEDAIRAWLLQFGMAVSAKARVAKLPFPGALMLALYGFEFAKPRTIERWIWDEKVR